MFIINPLFHNVIHGTFFEIINFEFDMNQFFYTFSVFEMTYKKTKKKLNIALSFDSVIIYFI